MNRDKKNTKKIEHGANLYEISESLGIEKHEIMDFSSNINPYGASRKAKEALIKNIDAVSVYPDPHYKGLKKAISEYCGVREESIILGSGATELIGALIKSVQPKKALLLTPAYSEYERELKKIGCRIDEFPYEKEKNFQINMDELIEKIKSREKNKNKSTDKQEYDLIVICNPNNPTGTSLTRDELEKILENYRGVLMVDETYIEFTEMEKYSGTPLIEKYPNLFLIRGTSKFFSTPGIRLGYGLVSHGELHDKITHHSNLWNINIFAAIMGEVMFSDREYIDRCRELILKEREYLLKSLATIEGIKVYNSTSNFILCEILEKNMNRNIAKDAEMLRAELLKYNMVIRDASKFSGLNKNFFRICILKSEENQKLIKKLKKIMSIECID